MKVYLDNAATTRVSPRVLEAMLPYFTEAYGNASSVHAFGREAAAAVEKARNTVAEAIHAQPREIFFTSGGTEADNWALTGAIAGSGKKHIVTSAIEHHAVLHTAEWLEKQGYTVTYLPVDGEGFVSPEAVRQAITGETALVSLMMANNEIGSVQPVAEIGAICAEKGVLFHTDAVQAFMQLPIDVEAAHIDMLSLSAHKLHGPKGVGALYVRKGVRLGNHQHGGAQERGKRPGTLNVPGIVGFGAAVEQAGEDMPGRVKAVAKLRDALLDGILEGIPETRLNGPRANRLPGNANVSIQYIEGESLLLMLDMKGIAASSGSACTSGSLDPSHVLLAIGLEHAVAHGSLRLTLSEENTPEEIDYVLRELPPIVERLRAMSPLYNK